MQTSGIMRSLLIALVVGSVGLLGLPAQSQQAELRIMATVAKIDKNVLVFRGTANGISSVSLDSETEVFIKQPSTLSAIKAGDYVASAAVKGSDGKLRSKDLRIFPEVLRGIGEGQRR